MARPAICQFLVWRCQLKLATLVNFGTFFPPSLPSCHVVTPLLDKSGKGRRENQSLDHEHN
jgi:hypothetical protein